MWAFDLSTSRIEALCDGVLAIAMTILVLELSMDAHILESISTGHFFNIFNEIFGYVMGFFIIGIYWALHHYIFHFIKRSNGVLIWLNVLFLMFAALVPLSTKVNNTYRESYIGYVFYMLTMIITFLLILVMWQYATRGYRLVDHDIGKEIINFVKKIIIIGTSLALVVMIVTYFIPEFGYVGFVPMAYVIIAIAYGHHKPFF